MDKRYGALRVISTIYKIVITLPGKPGSFSGYARPDGPR
jgi:hypothetical protein